MVYGLSFCQLRPFLFIQKEMEITMTPNVQNSTVQYQYIPDEKGYLTLKKVILSEAEGNSLPNLDGSPSSSTGERKQKIDAEGNVYTWVPSGAGKGQESGEGQWILTGHVDIPALEKKYGKDNLPEDLRGEVEPIDAEAEMTETV